MLLGEPFESQTAGITFRPPAGGKQIQKTDPDNVVEYVNDDKHWLLKVTRAPPEQARCRCSRGRTRAARPGRAPRLHGAGRPEDQPDGRGAAAGSGERRGARVGIAIVRLGRGERAVPAAAGDLPGGRAALLRLQLHDARRPKQGRPEDNAGRAGGGRVVQGDAGHDPDAGPVVDQDGPDEPAVPDAGVVHGLGGQGRQADPGRGRAASSGCGSCGTGRTSGTATWRRSSWRART